MAQMKSTSLKAFSEALRSEFEDVRIGYEDRDAIVAAARLVKAMRKKAGLTQVELADRIKTSQPEIVRLEAGTGSRGPTIQMLARVGVACHCDIVLGFNCRKGSKQAH